MGGEGGREKKKKKKKKEGRVAKRGQSERNGLIKTAIRPYYRITLQLRITSARTVINYNGPPRNHYLGVSCNSLPISLRSTLIASRVRCRAPLFGAASPTRRPRSYNDPNN